MDCKTNLTSGLTSEQVQAALEKYGMNELSAQHSTGALTIFVRQFQSTVVVLLLVAAAISLLMHEVTQAIAIFIAVFINALLGFITELKAAFSLKALENLAGPSCRVIREGQQQEVPARLLVPGDLVILDAGSRVPADLMLIEVASLSIEESMLSGESIPVYKQSTLENNLEEVAKAFQGTLVLSGRARGVVLATGNHTKLGKLGRLLAETVSTRTPLEEQLEKLGQQLTWLTMFLCGLLVLIGCANHTDVWLILQTSVALAVAAIPEGMPVVATLALAAGTRKMVKAGVLIRQLAAVETLGCTTVICSDKTGTLTENQMLVTDLILPARHLTVSGQGYEPEGDVNENGAPISALSNPNLTILLRSAALCNDAKLECHGEPGKWSVHGDPTEGAILAAAAKVGLDHTDLQCNYPRMYELPFDLNRKRMTTVHQFQDKQLFSCTKGSPKSVLALCGSIQIHDKVKPISAQEREWIIAQNDELAGRGLRVLAVASKEIAALKADFGPEELESELTFLGLIAMADQPRANVKAAIESCKKAGIRVMMLTGDQSETAAAVGRQLNIIAADAPGFSLLSGQQIQVMPEPVLAEALNEVCILARVNPEMKLNVVQRLQAAGEVVAMTGDGVNDAPALRQANIGVAMGLSGTALAREASNMVITDDNFSTIVKAVEEGRIIYGNIRQAIAYLLTASLSSILVVFVLVSCGQGAPFSPLQLLWLNLIMHIFPGLALVLQPAAHGIMSAPPRNPKEPLLTLGVQIQILARSVVVTAAVLSSMSIAALFHVDDVRTIGFATLSLSLILQALSWALTCRPGERVRFSLVCNSSMVLNLGLSALLLVAALYLPPLQSLIGTHALSFSDIGLVSVVAFLSFVITLFRLPSRFLPKGNSFILRRLNLSADDN